MDGAITHGTVPLHADAHALRLTEALRLATQIADECARTDIECHCAFERQGNHQWFDTAKVDDDDPACRRFVDRALRYLRLRDQIVVHPAVDTMVRFPR